MIGPMYAASVAISVIILPRISPMQLHEIMFAPNNQTEFRMGDTDMRSIAVGNLIVVEPK